jgi:hypothetical protein
MPNQVVVVEDVPKQTDAGEASSALKLWRIQNI